MLLKRKAIKKQIPINQSSRVQKVAQKRRETAKTRTLAAKVGVEKNAASPVIMCVTALSLVLAAVM